MPTWSHTPTASNAPRAELCFRRLPVAEMSRPEQDSPRARSKHTQCPAGPDDAVGACRAQDTPRRMEAFMDQAQDQVTTLYVSSTRQHWVVRDHTGRLWIVPQSPHPWEDRVPLPDTEHADLKPVPKHYQYLLGLPQ